MKLHTSAAILATLAFLPPLTWAQEQVIPRLAEISIDKDGEPIYMDRQPEIRVSSGDRSIITGTASPYVKAATQAARFLAEGMGKPALPLGWKFRDSQPAGTLIDIQPDEELRKQHGDEAYRIAVDTKYTAADLMLRISVASPKAIYPAFQTLAQMLPPAFFDPKADKNATEWKLADAPFTITDYPRFAWRAFMLDEARHFYGADAVKRIIDTMALLKMNILHWHLTDHGGWRIEIKKYPKLTSVGGKRRDTEIGTWRSGKYAGKPHEGHYTQDQIRDIVAYAADRGITIIPEIDVPGHAAAACASYPELKLTLKQPTEVPVTFAQDVALDPTNERVYEFVSDVLDEVITLFPSPIIHIGGDEVRFNTCWKGEPAIENFMKEKGYTQYAEVQMYFTQRIAELLRQKGRRLMGWNEILGHDNHGDGGGTADTRGKIDTSSVVHYWYGKPSIAIQALKDGYSLVNSVADYTYLDFDYKRTPLSKAYSFEPAFKGMAPDMPGKLLGIGCQMWTEWVPDRDRLDYQMYPRVIAHAETGWTQKKRKNYAGFLKRMENFRAIMDAKGIRYAKDEIK